MTVHRLTEAANASLGSNNLVAFVQIDTNVGIVASEVTAFGQWKLAPVHVTAGSVSAGTYWTPSATPHPVENQQVIGLGGGIAVYIRSWEDGVGGQWGEFYVLTTSGSTITVDSVTDFNTDLGLPGRLSNLGKTAALAVLITRTHGTLGVNSLHRVDISSGSITVTTPTGSEAAGSIFVHDDYTIEPGFSGSLDAIDGQGNIVTSLTTPVNGLPTYLPLTANTGVIIGESATAQPAWAFITLSPLTITSSGSGPGPTVIDGPTASNLAPFGGLGVDYAQITGSPTGEAWFFYGSELDFDSEYPPGDEAWNTAPDGSRRSSRFPDVFTFQASPVFGWDHSAFNNRPSSYIDGTLGDYINMTHQLVWPQGVGAGTIVVAYTGSTDLIVAVLAVTTLAPPTAHLTVTPTTGAGPLTVTADATASTAPVALVSAGWDFGDGTITGGGFTKSHLYNPPVTSTFTVVVTVFDWFQQSASASTTVHVTVVPKTLPPLRQYPRDDALGGAPRQGHANGATSIQSSARQGWRNTYR